jgi:hypothetical protein
MPSTPLPGAAAKHHHAPGGLYERIFLGLELPSIAIALPRHTPREQAQRQVKDTKTVTPRNTSNT